ncbi:MAG: serine dehydrogenasease [Desulfobacca sp.]|nr:serine dehydrogenasease [Desulfobacca sp.]
MRLFDEHIQITLRDRLGKLEEYFESNVIFFYGAIYPGVEKVFRDFIEKLKAETPTQNRLTIVLSSPGGLAETVEKLVDIIRFHYPEVYFVVPDYAMSAGTIFCMSGDKIFMDYSSSLGPIDPQVFNGKEYVPALGYLDQMERMIQKSKDGELSDAELLILQQQDLALLSRYEQAKNLTITLLKKWLAQYKFHNWQVHRTNKEKIDQPVTQQEKEQRAEEIANLLADNKLWHSHGRMIGINTLTSLLRLEIDDYSKNIELRNLIRYYNDFLVDYINRHNMSFFLHSKNYF